METTRLSTKGQVILPKAVRSSRAWLPGTRFAVEETPEGVPLRPLSRFPETRLEDVAGCLKYRGNLRPFRRWSEASYARSRSGMIAPIV
jgi:AbrB family looped-hinge helix DNA binding protein